MAKTLIKYKQLDLNLKIVNADISTTAAIATSKLADGANFIQRNGSVAFTANQSHGGFKITNLADGTAASDAINKGQLDAAIAGINIGQFELLSNKKDSLAVVGTGNAFYPSIFAVNAGLALKEDLVNKATSLASPDNIKYPTTLAVSTAIDGILTTVAGLYIPLSQKAQANGVATLDGLGKVPASQLPDAVLGNVNYQGTWNASTNIPALPPANTVKGHYYVIQTAGNSAAGNAPGIAFSVGDWVISNGTQWQQVDNQDILTDGLNYFVRFDTGTQGLTTPQQLNARTNIGAAADSEVVKLTGNQTIAGIKTFSSSPVVPTATLGNQAVNKAQMDAAILAAGTGNLIFNEVPAGTMNGVNVTFTLANAAVAGKEVISLNGQKLKSGAANDYTISGATITFTATQIPEATDVIEVMYVKV